MSSNYGKIEESKNHVINLYVDDRKSLRQISKETGFSRSGIKRVLHKYNIPMRNKCASLNLCPTSFEKNELSILVGSLLGDGALVPIKPEGESCFYEGHCKEQLSYLEWKYDNLQRFIGCKVYPLTHTIKGKKYKTYNFLTRRSFLFTQLRKMFYEDLYEIDSPKKIEFNFIVQHMNPLCLAVWFMDDGHRSSKNMFSVQSQSFTKEDNEKLIDAVKMTMNIQLNLKKYSNGTGWIIRSEYEETHKMIDVIKSYFHECLYYKLRLENPQRLYVEHLAKSEMKIESELHGDMQRQAEMTCPPKNVYTNDCKAAEECKDYALQSAFLG